MLPPRSATSSNLLSHKLDDFLKPEFLARVAGYKILAAVKGNSGLGGAIDGDGSGLPWLVPYDAFDACSIV